MKYAYIATQGDFKVNEIFVSEHLQIEGIQKGVECFIVFSIWHVPENMRSAFRVLGIRGRGGSIKDGSFYHIALGEKAREAQAVREEILKNSPKSEPIFI